MAQLEQFYIPRERAEAWFRTNHRTRTVTDLWGIPLAGSKPIKPITDMYCSTWTVDELDWGKAWALYRYNQALQFAAQQPQEPKTWFDHLRFNLHIKLIQWKVLI